MSRRRILTAAVLTITLGCGLGVGGAAVATAAPSSTVVPTASTTLHVTTGTTAALAGALGSVAGTTSAPTTPTSVAFTDGGAPSQSSLLRLIVTTALTVLRAAAPASYNQLVSVVSQGMTAFIMWWTTSAPAWVKGLVDTVSAVALYAVIRLILNV